MKRIAVLLTLAYLLTGCASKDWTLIVCETSHPTGGCGDNRYVLKGYKTQKDCMEKGIEIKNPEGFECGYGCKESDYGTQVCDEVCNEKGCN